MENNFLAMNKQYRYLKLKCVDMVILSQIDEFHRNGCKCYMTNQQFAEVISESVRTATRSLDRLEERNFIKRNTVTQIKNGFTTKVRTIDINYKAINEAVKMTLSTAAKQETIVSNVQNDSAKSLKKKCQNGTIKEKEKEKKKDNIGGDNNLSSKKEKYNINLPDLDNLIDILKEQNINCTKDDVISAYNDVHNSNCIRQYKWNCEDLGNFVKYTYHSDNPSFQDVLDNYDEFIASMLDFI